MANKHVLPACDNINPKYLCAHCSFVLQDPLQTPCAHFYCTQCINAIHSGNMLKCKVDGSRFAKDEVFPDACVRNEVNNLTVHCINFEDGCTWEGKLQGLENHLSLCDYVEVQCVYKECTKWMPKSYYPEHLKNECTQRQVKCVHCDEEMQFFKMEEHNSKLCQAFPINCTLCQEPNIPRGLLSQHHSMECKETKSVCPFLSIGCREKGEMGRQTRKHHDESTLHFHVNLLLQFVNVLKEQIGHIAIDVNPLREAASFWIKARDTFSQMVSQVAVLAFENTQIRGLVQGLQVRLTAVEEKCSSEVQPASLAQTKAIQLQLQQLVSVSNDVVRKISNVEAKEENHELLLVETNRALEQERLEKEQLKGELATSTEDVRALKRRVETLEQLLRNIASPMLLEPPSYDGVLLWKIPNVTEKRNDAITGRQTSLYSADFYTSRHGYRMCARIYLNGDGMGRGTHISVFFAIKRSEHDVLLRWPFRQKVTIMLLDQDNVEHVTDAFRPDPNSSSFQRPRRDMNIASGCPLFCALSQLERRAYIKEDVMFLKIIVDCSDL